MSSHLDRRAFAGAATGLFTIVPRHVLGGPMYVPPSDKITLAHIGMGSQSFMELGSLLSRPDIQIVAVCDPNANSSDYVEWSPGMVKKAIRKILGDSTWRENDSGCPGGREVGKEVIETYYTKQRGANQFRGCHLYSDFRELLEKETGIDAVKIMTPDHLHATIAIAAMKKGKSVAVHKPLANRMYEARLVIDTAKRTQVATYLLAYGSGAGNARIVKEIQKGVIGRLREIHNWSNRPVWPQYAQLPTEKPPVPEGMDWDLWLGPSLDRPYHPQYTHATFRGWYEFGGGSLADMGIYSLWPVLEALGLSAPVSAEAFATHTNHIVDHVSRRVVNDWSFPLASTIHFKFAAEKGKPGLDLFWYDGGMRPRTPEEIASEDTAWPIQGILFVGEKGKIMAGFLGQDPQLLTSRGRKPLLPAQQAQSEAPQGPGEPPWLASFKGGPPALGAFTAAGPITEMVNLGSIALRARTRVVYDSKAMKITSASDANRFLYREYREGWRLA